MPNNNIINTTFSAINSGVEHAILTGVRSVYKYVDGKRQGEAPVDSIVSVVLPGNAYTTLNVKIEGNPSPLDITDEDIQNACMNLCPLYVKFADCKVKLYTINGTMGMSATASDVKFVQFKQ